METITNEMESNMTNRVIELLNDIKVLIKDKTVDRWININEVSRYTSVSSSTIRRAVKRGKLKASQSTGKLLFKLSNVDRWLNETYKG
jgi:excisionase family DNA binding protein